MEPLKMEHGAKPAVHVLVKLDPYPYGSPENMFRVLEDPEKRTLCGLPYQAPEKPACRVDHTCACEHASALAASATA